MMYKCTTMIAMLLICAYQTTPGYKLLQQAYTQKNDPQFLAHFPSNFNSFQTTFGWNEKADLPYPLYNDANAYIDHYFSLAARMPNKSYKMNIVNIAATGVWQADAVNYFLIKLRQFTETDPDVNTLLHKLNENELTGFWKFYFSKPKAGYDAKLAQNLDAAMREKSLAVYRDLSAKENREKLKEKQDVYVVDDKDGYANLRTTASTAGTIAGRVNTGEIVRIIKPSGQWWLVKTTGGLTGYIHQSRVKPKTADVLNPPASLYSFHTISPKFNYEVVQTALRPGNTAPAEMRIRITDKKTGAQRAQVIFKPQHWINHTCIAASYLGKTKTNEGVDTYHQLITADFNFDGLEDFAILTDEGSNAGPRYSYFLQTPNKLFTADKSFPLQSGFFPDVIDAQAKTLTVSRPEGCCKINTTTYKRQTNGRWVVTAQITTSGK